MRLALTILATTLVLSTAAVAPAQVINEYVAAHTGTDDHEYIEILGAASTDYSGLAILEIEGDSGQNPGTVDSIVVPGTTDGNGRWVSSFLTDEFEDDAMTLLLVSGFSGSLGQDLDTDDDGVFDITPWTSIRDEVGVQDETAGIMYTTVVLLPGSDGLSFGFGGGSRLPDGTDTDTASDWQRNDWNGAGLPGFSGSPDPNDALNTPGTENLPAIVASGPVLNEFVINHSGADTAEFVEIHGDNGASYSDWSIVVIDGDHDVTPGRVDFVATAGTTDGLGVWSVTTAADALPDGSCTILLARNVTATVGDDLDTNDDGSLDLTPWTDQGDAVAVTDGDPGDVVYATIVLESNFDGGTTPVWGASRIPSGFDSGSTSDWWRNDFEGAGLDGLVGSLEAGDAVNTAGWTNRVGLLSDYYATVDAADPTTLRTTLHQAIDDHVHVTYSSSLEDVWDVLEYADEDPADDSQVLTIYHNRTFAKFGGGQGPYNREHSWPRSYGFKDDGPDNYPHDDCHHLFASDVGYNSARGSRALDDCSASCAEYTTDAKQRSGRRRRAVPRGLQLADGPGPRRRHLGGVDRPARRHRPRHPLHGRTLRGGRPRDHWIERTRTHRHRGPQPAGELVEQLLTGLHGGALDPPGMARRGSRGRLGAASQRSGPEVSGQPEPLRRSPGVGRLSLPGRVLCGSVQRRVRGRDDGRLDDRLALNPTRINPRRQRCAR
jgi:hypothetical protein